MFIWRPIIILLISYQGWCCVDTRQGQEMSPILSPSHCTTLHYTIVLGPPLAPPGPPGPLAVRHNIDNSISQGRGGGARLGVVVLCLTVSVMVLPSPDNTLRRNKAIKIRLKSVSLIAG